MNISSRLQYKSSAFVSFFFGETEGIRTVVNTVVIADKVMLK